MNTLNVLQSSLLDLLWELRDTGINLIILKGTSINCFYRPSTSSGRTEIAEILSKTPFVVSVSNHERYF